MAWAPIPSEQPLVDCSLVPGEGLRFNLRLTERHLCYSRRSNAASDPLETVIVERRAISNVVLKKLLLWQMQAVGVVLMLATTAGVVALPVVHSHSLILLGYVFGGACFLGSSDRWVLSFSDGTKTHKLVQPVASDTHVMNLMADALQKTAGLIGSGGARLIQ